MTSQPAIEHGPGSTSVRFIKHSGELALLSCGATGKIALRSLDDPSRVIRTFANKAAASPALYSLAVHPTKAEFVTGGAEHVRVRALSSAHQPYWQHGGRSLHGRAERMSAFPRCRVAASVVNASGVPPACTAVTGCNIETRDLS